MFAQGRVKTLPYITHKKDRHSGFPLCLLLLINLDAGQLQQLGNLGFPAQSHDVHTLAVGLALLDDLSGDLHTGDTGLGALLVSSQSVDHVLGHMDTGHIVVHELGHACGLGNDDTQLDGLAELLSLLSELDELLGIEHSLGLEVLSTGHDLALHLSQLSVHAVGAGGRQ